MPKIRQLLLWAVALLLLAASVPFGSANLARHSKRVLHQYNTINRFKQLIDRNDHSETSRQRRTSGLGIFAFTHPTYNVTIKENSRGRVFAEPQLTPGERMGIYLPDPQGVVRYKIVNGDTNDYFKASSHRIGNFAYLRIRIRPSLDVTLNRELQDNYQLLVKSTFKQPGRNKLETRATVNLTITDANDLTPLFLLGSIEEDILDDTPMFSEVAQVYASDADSGLNGEVYYSLLEPSDTFAVHPVTGKITLVGELNAQQQHEYKLVVKAEDRASRFISGPGRPDDFSRANVRIRVKSANRHPPTVHLSDQSATALRQTSQSQLLTTIRVSDADHGRHGEVGKVRLLGDPDGWFRVRQPQSDKPNVFVLETMPGDPLPTHISQYNLTIVVTDRGKPHRTTQTPLTIRAIDAKASKAQFLRDTYLYNANETSPSWTLIGFVDIIDSGQKSISSFTIADRDLDVPFTINNRTGALYVNEPLDYERTKQYEFKVELRRIELNGTDTLLDTATVKVTILDENDHSPLFTTDSLNANLVLDPSIIEVESTVFTVSASDQDSGHNGRVSYRVVNEVDNNPFIVDQWTGEVKLRTPFASVAPTGAWQLLIRASDWGTPLRRENETSVNIRLKGATFKFKRSAKFASDIENDYAPVFTQRMYKSSVREDARVGPSITCVLALDKDLGYAGFVQYTIDPDSDRDSLFNIDMYSGCVMVARNLTLRTDKTRHSVQLKIQAQDMAVSGSRRYSDATVEIEIEDVNNHAPVFERLRYRLRISEDARYPTELLQVVATDVDKDENGRVTYSLMTKTAMDVFSVNATTGLLSLIGELDRERMEKYELTIAATDAGLPSMSSTTIVSVQVQDVNDNPPRCVTKWQKIQLIEDWPSGALVTCVKAIDSDEGRNGEFSFALDHVRNSQSSTITKPDGKSASSEPMKVPFRIHPNTGCVWIDTEDGAKLDYELKPVYNLSVEVTDNGQPQYSGVCGLIIELIDVNENLLPPKFEQFASQATVFENQPIGTEVARITAKDPERPDESPIYSLISEDGLGLFNIDSNGVIRSLAHLDREQKSFYWLTVIARDTDPGHPLEAAMDIYITVADRNDHAPRPKHAPLIYASVPENSPPGTLVTRVQGVDPDTGTSEGLRYEIVRGDPQSFFKIDEVTGYISTHRRRLDRETMAEHELVVQITDTGDPQLSTDVYVIVQVDDVNDVAPEFMHQMYHFNVPEVSTSHPHQLLCRVVANDGDTGLDTPLIYNMSASDANVREKFEIDRTTGEIFAVQSIKAAEKFALTVGVSDGQHSAECRVMLDVLDSPDPSRSHNHAPTVRSSAPIELLISDSDSVGKMLALLEAADVDGDSLWFDVVGDDLSRDQFMIRRDTGELQLVKPIDPDGPQEFHMTYRVSDGVDSLEAQAHIRIRRTTASRPRFTSDAVQVTIDENLAVGSTIVDLDAIVNTTSGSDGTIVYSIHALESTGSRDKFKVEPTSGRVVLIGSLDHEVLRAHRIVVAARHRTLAALCTVDIDVRDVNDHTPTFSQSRYSVSVIDSAAIGRVLLTVTASDEDTGENARIAYTIASGNEQGLWSLDESNGQLSVAKSLTLTFPESVLVVRASDHGTPSRSDTATVRLLITMAQESAPRFMRHTYTAKLPESSPIGGLVTSVFADSRSGVRYSLATSANKQQRAIFNVHPTSGIITLMAPLDYETQPFVNFSVEAESSSGAQSQAQVQVHVQDSNDHAPIFKDDIYSGSVQENRPAGTVVMTDLGQPLVVSALDGDRGANALVSYDVVTTWARQYFTVDYGTGAVRTKMELDFEKMRSYEFEVRAHDMGVPSRVSPTTALVNVTVVDVNDNAPTLTLDKTHHTLTLPTVNDVHIVRVQATDVDTVGHLTYRIAQSTSPGSDLFKIDVDTGDLTVAANDSTAFKHEYYEVPIEVSDGKHITTGHLTIDIDDLSSTSKSSGFRFRQSKYSVSVVENVTLDSEQTVLVMDTLGTELGEHILYRLLNPNDWFVLGAVSGELRSTGLALDRELTPNLTLVVQATDHRQPPRRAQTIVNVQIQDVNDSPPRFLHLPYYAVVPLDAAVGYNVTSCLALDDDADRNAQVRYSIVRNAQDYFAIDAHSGLVTVAKRFPEGMKSTKYDIDVSATDLGEPSLSSTCTVSIKVVNRAMPVFDRAFYSAEVRENLEIGSDVMSISAMSHVNGTIGYAVVDGDPMGLFTLDYITGTIRVRRGLDRELAAYHNLTIRAVDVARPGVSAEVPIVIKVLDVNDNAPQFDNFSYKLQLAESAPIGTKLATIHASDQDLGPNGLVHYTLAGRDADAFDINSETGELHLMRPLDYETQTKYKITLIATDSGVPEPLSASAECEVQITDVNDCAPVFSQASYTASVTDDAVPGHFVTKLHASDQDTGLRPPTQLTYSIIDGDASPALFSVQPQTGVVTVARVFLIDELRIRSYTLNVSVSDGVFTATTVLLVHVHATVSRTAAPVFERTHYDAMIAEKDAIGAPVLSVRAVGGALPLTYTLGGDVRHSSFLIDTHSGRITIAEALDYEQHRVHRLPLVATDNAGRRTFATVTVTIGDTNDNAPEFVANRYRLSIESNATIGARIGEFTAIDPDANDLIEYSMESDNEELWNYVDLHRRTGVLTVRRSLSSQLDTTLTFAVRAADRGNPPLQRDVPVELMIVPEDQGAVPRAKRHTYEFSVAEDVQIGTVVGRVHVHAQDMSAVNLGIVSASNEESGQLPFTIMNDGKIKTVMLLDREQTETYTFVVQITDKNNDALTSTTVVKVQISDVNDNSPMFQANYENLQISEDAAIGTSLAVLSATDKDTGAAAEIRFELKPTIDFPIHLFRVDPSSGWLMLNSELDREQRDYYEFTVLAVDNGYPPLTTTTNVKVRVLDANDEHPYFLYPDSSSSTTSYRFSVSERASRGTVVGRILVRDLDLPPNNQTSLYIVDGDENGVFGLRNDGELYLQSELDYERIKQHRLTVLASDGVHSNETLVFVVVIDENDNTPRCETEFAHVRYSEARPIGSEIFVFLADDLDANDEKPLEYSLSGTGSEQFEIKQNGMLVISAPLDRETSDSYTLTVKATDIGGKMCQTIVKLTVLDENDTSPKFEKDHYEISIPENLATDGHFLLQLTAVDADLGAAGQVLYALKPTLNDVMGDVLETFTVDALTGALTVRRALDREQREWYNLTVVATDQGHKPLSGNATITIHVLDVNDNPPVFERTKYNANVSETIDKGTTVLHVHAVSLDAKENAKIRYHLIAPETVMQLFSIDKNSGEIESTGELDYESQRLYTFQVEAVDSGVPPLSTSVPIEITVSDANDNAPKFTQPSQTALVPENSEIGSEVTQLLAHDADSGANGEIVYSLSNASADALYYFDITNDGHLIVSGALDREKKSSYRAIIEACDRGVPDVQCTSAAVEITITDVNDNAPVFEECNFNTTVRESAKIGYEILSVAVSDADDPPHGGPFEFVVDGPGAEHFTMDSDGVLSTARKLKYQDVPVYLLTVIARDSGKPPLQSECPVTIKVLEESKYAPVIQPMSVRVISYLGEFPGATIGKVRATDKDERDVLVFGLVQEPASAQNPLFGIDPQDGTIVAAPGLSVGTHQLNVSVTDGKFTAYGKVTVEVKLVTEDTLNFALSMRMKGVSAGQFLADFRKKFASTIAGVLGVRPEQIELLSVQETQEDTRRHRTNRRRRLRRDDWPWSRDRLRRASNADKDTIVEVLFTVSQGDSTFYKPSFVRRRLESAMNELKDQLNVPAVALVTEVCRRDLCVRGDCRDRLTLHDKQVSVVTDAENGGVFMSPKHKRNYECLCQQGFGGKRCNVAVNACSRDPCDTHELCVPLETSAGYTCVCAAGRASALKCPADKCKQGGCAKDQPMSFTGNSYLRYTLSTPLSRRLDLDIEIRTMAPNGVIMHMAGQNDFHTLEVRGGYLMYSFDCGSGPGQALVSDHSVTDGKWHNVTVRRRGSHVKLSLDKKHHAESYSTGPNTVINLDSNDVYFGAEVMPHPTLYGYDEISRAFIGCINKIFIDSFELPRSKPGLRVFNVEFHCKDSFIAGVCSSQPCQNFGTCIQQLGDTYTCDCPTRYTGRNCEIDRNPCASNPCAAGATCENRLRNEFRCVCPPGRTGKTCADTGDQITCASKPCRNGGRCTQRDSYFICNCTATWTGPTCEDERNGGTHIIGAPFGLTWLEVAAIAVAALALIFLAILLCCCCKRHSRRYRYHKAPYMQAVNNELLIDQQPPHLRNPHVVGSGSRDIVPAPPLPPRASTRGQGAHQGYKPTPPHSKLSNLQQAQMTGLPTGLVRPLSIADRGGSTFEYCGGDGSNADQSSSCGQPPLPPRIGRAAEYGSAAGSLEGLEDHTDSYKVIDPRRSGRRRGSKGQTAGGFDRAPPPPAHMSQKDWSTALQQLGDDSLDRLKQEAKANDEIIQKRAGRGRQQSLANSIQCLAEDDDAMQIGAKWFTALPASIDWRSTVDRDRIAPGQHSTLDLDSLPPGVSAIEDLEDDINTAHETSDLLRRLNEQDGDRPELKSSPAFRRQLMQLQKIAVEANETGGHVVRKITPKANKPQPDGIANGKPMKVVAPSSLREDEYVTMRPVFRRGSRDESGSGSGPGTPALRQPLLTNGGKAQRRRHDSESEDEGDADSCGAVVQYQHTPAKSGANQYRSADIKSISKIDNGNRLMSDTPGHTYDVPPAIQRNRMLGKTDESVKSEKTNSEKQTAFDGRVTHSSINGGSASDLSGICAIDDDEEDLNEPIVQTRQTQV